MCLRKCYERLYDRMSIRQQYAFEFTVLISLALGTGITNCYKKNREVLEMNQERAAEEIINTPRILNTDQDISNTVSELDSEN